MNDIWSGIITIAVAIIGVATLSVLVSKQSNTANVLQAAGESFSGALSTAVSPVTGASGVSIPSYSHF
jgi:hypothetical protein